MTASLVAARARGGVATAAGVAVLALVLAPGVASGYGVQDVAGTLNDEPVTLGEIDDALGGTIRTTWARIDAIYREATRAVCEEYALVRVTAETGMALMEWRAERWAAARPDAAAVQKFSAANRHTFGGKTPDRRQVEHLLQVRAYREAVQAATGRLLEGDYTLALPPAPARFDAEPDPPAIMAQCLGHMVSRHEVEAFASFPLYRRRADVVASTCRQFDIDYSNPVVLHRMAQARGLTVDELMREAEGEATPISDADVEEAARARYGEVDDSTLARVRFALTAKQKVDGRMAFLEKVRTETTGACALELPPAPTATVRGTAPGGAPGGRLRVSYFGGFRCDHCADGWAVVERLREAWGGRIHVDVRHHFPAMVRSLFDDAREAHCSAWAGRLWEYVEWRTRAPTTSGSPVEALGLDAAAFGKCMRDPTTAVAVIADADEALRLGFREAVPSWVIGHEPRRGFQGDRILNDSVKRQLDGITLASHDQHEEGTTE